jgi:ferric-dicitrate binding protein FerR (iron transport regulator)
MVMGAASSEEIEKWDNWIEENTRNREKANKAISEITGFHFSEPQLPDIEQEWAKLYSKTAGARRAHIHHRRKKEQRLKWLFRVAAILLLSSLVGLGFYNFSEVDESLTHVEQLTEEKAITTAEGEQKTITFSNGSRIVLNSNSTLSYSLGLLRNQTIDVTLEGEAWFDVESDLSKEKPAFAVRTPDGIIRDIGTKFLVTVQQGQSRVVLQEGIVEVERVQVNSDGLQKETEVFRVEKGEMVEFNRSDILRREHVNPTFYSAWATQFMQFDQTSLGEFADYVEQRFDVNVQIKDPDVKYISLDGAVYFRSLEELVRSVSEVAGIPVYRSEDRKMVHIGNPGN